MSGAKGIAAAVTIAACWFGLARALADPIAMGSGRQTVDLDGIRLKVFTYRPDGCADLSLLLVFHGNARDADRTATTRALSPTRTACWWSHRCWTAAHFRSGAISTAAW